MSDNIGTTLDGAAPPVAALSSELSLRIRGGDYHGRIVRIRASQCTVGSAPDCTLRLSGPGIRPLHCIILRGDAGATVRRWSPDTQLNGRAFSDALLMPGDRLGIGPIELEVLDDADVSPNRRAEMAASTIPVAELAQEVVSQLRRDLRRDKSARQSEVEKRQLRKSQRRIKSLEAELARLQASANSIAAIDSPPAPPHQVDTARFEAERGTWNNERQSLLSRLQERENLTQRLEYTIDELRKTVEHEGLVATADQRQDNHGSSTDHEQLQGQYNELFSRFQAIQEAEAAASAQVKGLQERIASLEHAANHTWQESTQTSEAFQSTQRQLHETFAECERLREELHQANCALASAQCRLTEQEAALTAFREMHHHAIAELELECKTLQSQLTDAQSKFDEQTGRLAELESQSHSIPTPEQSGRIAELESQIQAHVEELSSVRAAKDELQSAVEQSRAEWTRREQELMQRNDCLERLAANLEDELRKATSSPDQVQAAQEQIQSLEQQLASVQRQWSEQRQVLEDQALSAHQQIHEMENQVASMRDALHTAQGQVRERDQLLVQLRDEIRQQLASWQQERDQLLEHLAAAGQGRQSEDSEARTPHPNTATFLPDEINSETGEDRYGYPQMLAGGHVPAEVNEADLPCASDASEASPDCSPSSVAEVLSRLETAGIWRPQEEWGKSSQHGPGEPNEDAPVAEAVVATPDALVGASGEPCYPDNEMRSVAHVDTASDDSNNSTLERGDGSTQPVGIAPAHPSVGKSSDEDESIEAYMARLLKRVRGDAVANGFVEQQATTGDGLPVAPVPNEHVGCPTESTSDAPITAQEFVPRKLPPEQATDVKAMRELAIQSTRQAISRSSQLRFQRKSLATTLGACGFAALSIGLFAWAFDTGNWLAWSGCAASLIGTGYLTSLRLKTRWLLKPAA